MTVLELEQAHAFGGEDVVRCYSARPPYPGELYRFLLQLPPSRGRALDLGCGPGKIALALADSFEQVDAIDPSAAMIEAGIRTDNGAHPNVEWLVANAEDAVLSGPYDLVTAGASIHWMRHDIVFPKLVAAMPTDGVLAIVSGDDASGLCGWSSGQSSGSDGWKESVDTLMTPVSRMLCIAMNLGWT